MSGIFVKKLEQTISDYISLVNLDNIQYEPLSIEDHWRIPLVKELLDARAGRTIVHLSMMEINAIIYMATTS